MPLPENVVRTYYRGADEVQGEYGLRRFRFAVDADGVALATWCTPERRNCLSEGAVWELYLLLEHVARDPDVKVLVLTGEGSHFSAGMAAAPDPIAGLDAEVMDGYARRGLAQRSEGVRADMAAKGLALAFLRCPKVIISAVNGPALGGGVSVALLFTDHSIVVEDAWFRYPVIDMGLTPAGASTFVLPEAMGLGRAKSVLLFGERFTAREALQCGLCGRVVATAEEALADSLALARRVASSNQTALRLAKRLLHRHALADLEAQLDAENEAINAASTSEETKASMRAFANRFRSRSDAAGKGNKTAKL